MAQVNPRVFLDLSVDSGVATRIVFELFKDETPITCENFRCLCTGEKGLAAKSGLPLHFKGSRIHRVIDQFMIQGGDFTKHNGSGGESIYGAPFDDEGFDRPVDKEGLLVMANRGPNTNGAQFFITVAPAEHLNGKHVCFGRVVAGFDYVLAISKLPTGPKDAPRVPVEIVHCGELQRVVKKPARPRSESVSSRSSSRSRSASVSPPPRKKKKHRSDKKEKKEKKSKKLRLKETGHQDQLPTPDEVATQAVAKSRREEEEEAESALAAERAERDHAEKARRLAEIRKQHDLEGRGLGINFKGSGRMAYREDRGSSRGMRGWAD